MNENIEYDLEDEEQIYPTFTKIKRSTTPKGKPTKKVSYESNADVQRWLKEQTGEADGRTKPAFNPTFLAAQRDAPWILSSLTQFYDHDLITDVLHVIKSGKEATVYCCTADPATGMDYLAAKVYRPRMFRSLRNDAVYRQSRTQRDIDGRVVRSGSHHRNAFKSERGRAAQVSSWIEYEFQTQRLLYDAGADVPRPLAQMGNAVLMEYIGDVGQAAPLLQEVALEQEEAETLFRQVLHNVELFLMHHRVHGDLSEYNILYWQGHITIIDFAQAIDPRYNIDVFALLQRDIERICSYFAEYGVKARAHLLAADIWARCMGERSL